MSKNNVQNECPDNPHNNPLGRATSSIKYTNSIVMNALSSEMILGIFFILT